MYKYRILLDSYLRKYNKKPYSKQLKSNLLRFEDMYQPNEGSFNAYKFLPGYKEDLQFLKSQVYLTKKSVIKVFDDKYGKQILLTSSGKRVLFKQYPLQKLREKKWDETWSLISYDITYDKKRNSLRKLLIDNGFGILHQSLLVSPLNIGEGIYKFLDSQSLTKDTVVYRCKNVFGLSNVEIAYKSFNIDELNKLYKDIFTNFYKVKNSNKKLLKWKDYFLAVNYFDPYLPYELLPNDWKGDDCVKLFKTNSGFIYNVLSKLKKI